MIKNGSQMNRVKLFSSNPDRLDLLMESVQFSEVLSPVVQSLKLTIVDHQPQGRFRLPLRLVFGTEDWRVD